MALGNKRIMGDNIQRQLDRVGMDRRELAEKIGVSYTSVTEWLNGKSYPRIDKIQSMADLFGIEKADLVEHPSVRLPKSATRIPVLGAVAAGIPIEAITDVVDYEEISPELASRGEYFGLRIKGESMAPRILEGDIVIVRMQSDAESGDIVIVQVNGDSATCKKLIKHQGGVALQALNPAYEPMYYSNEDIEKLPVVVIGKVVELRGKL